MTDTQVKRSPEGVPGAISDPASIAGEDVKFTGASEGTTAEGGSHVNGYLARPVAVDAAHPVPGMIVIHEAMGLNEHIRDVTNRIANLGYVALGVDLYTREGGPPPTGDLQAMMQRLFSMSDATCSVTSRARPTSCPPART
jgi:dienelactone hydrolase